MPQFFIFFCARVSPLSSMLQWVKKQMTWFIFEMLERAHVLVIKILLIVLTLCVNLTRNEDVGSQSWMLQVTNNLSSARDCKTPNISQERKPLIKHYTWQSGFVFKSVAYNAYSFQIVNREFSVEVRELSWTWFSTRFFFLCVSSLIQNILPVLHQALMYCSLWELCELWNQVLFVVTVV